MAERIQSLLVEAKMDYIIEYKRKFIREAKNLSKLDHPNIVKVLELFEANNTAYYVMEYIDGGNLNEYIGKQNGLSGSMTNLIITYIVL